MKLEEWDKRRRAQDPEYRKHAEQVDRTIFFIREETTFGPFFGTKVEAIEYLRSDCFDDEVPEEERVAELKEMVEGRHHYINLVEVTLGDTSKVYGG